MDDGSSSPGQDASPTPVEAATTTTGGVDPTLIRWMLSLTPEARLRWLDNVLRTLSWCDVEPDLRALLLELADCGADFVVVGCERSRR